MPELNYKNLKSHLKTLKKGQFAPVYLLYGEEFLYKNALEELLNLLMTASERNQNYESVAGANENIPDIIARVNTYSLLPGPKVVAIIDSKIFYSKLDAPSFLAKAKAAYDTNDFKKASKYLVNLLGMLELTYDDVVKEDRNRRLKIDPDTFGNDAWLDKIINYCRDNRLPIPRSQDTTGVLQQSVEKGFPNGNHLFITTDMVDKRRTLYKCILNNGTVIDCSVPKGDRRADKMAQEAVLKEQMQAILSQRNKTMRREAYLALIEMTGFDLRTFSSNLEKLVNYVGDRIEICVDDIETVLQRTKRDPLYELTNSVADRNIQNALFFLDSLLGDNVHPLQIMVAITNQIRKLLVMKDFTDSPYGKTWRAGMNYNHFKNNVMPAIEAYDRETLDRLEDWDKMMLVDDDINKHKQSRKKNKIKTDLLIIKNLKNPYPVFQMLQKTQGFSGRDLRSIFETLSEADMQLKSTSKDLRLILEKVIFSICKQNEK